jgi:hypothetical protein
MVLVGKREGKSLGVDGKTELIQIANKYNGRAWTGFIWLGIGTIGGLL